MIQPISKAEIRYGDTNQGYVTMRAVRNEEGKMDITIIDAFFRTSTGEELVSIIADFKSRVQDCDKEQPAKITKPKPVAAPKPAVEKKQRKTRVLFTDEQKADIIKRYQAGEGPKAIAESLGVNRNTVGNIIKSAGAVEGRTGQHLHKKKEPEPLPEEENEPV